MSPPTKLTRLAQTLPLAIILLLLLVVLNKTIWAQFVANQNYQLSQQPQTLSPRVLSRGPTQQQPIVATSNQQQQQQPPPIRSPCPRAIRMNTNYQFRGTLHFICLQAGAAGGWPKLDVIQYTNQQVVMSMDLMETETDLLASFVDEMGNLRILLAKSSRFNGTSMYSVDPVGQFFNETHTINSQFVSALSIWRMELNWEFHLAIANQPTYEFPTTTHSHLDSSYTVNHHQGSKIPDLRPMISMFTWRSTYFDLYQFIYLPEGGRVNKLEPMHINGQEFLIVAMESNRVSESSSSSNGADSLIYKLDFGDGTLRWAQYQSLNTRLAFDAKSFAISHQGSLQRDYYIALIGQVKRDPMEPWSNLGSISNNMTSYNGGYGGLSSSAELNPDEPYGLVIYKYFGDKFRLTEHLLPIPGAIKLDTITYGGGGAFSGGDSYVIIALLSSGSGSGGSNHINLYLFDGLKLTPMSGPYGRPQPPPQSYVNNGHPYLRQRRTMENSANFHLFRTQPTKIESSGAEVADHKDDTTGQQQKRTLTVMDESHSSMAMPALAISSATGGEDESVGDDNPMNYNSSIPTTPARTDSIYHIPIAEMIKEDMEQQQEQQRQINDTTYTKRNHVVGDGRGENSLAWCRAKVGELLNDNFDLIARKLLALPRVDQASPIELNGDLIVENDLHVSNLLYTRRILEKNQQVTNQIEAPPFFESQTFEQIHRAHGQIRNIERQVDRILVDDGSQQDVFRPLAFDTLIVECKTPASFDPRFMHVSHGSGFACPHVDQIRTVRLNSRNITSINQQALLTNRPMEIRSDVRFEHLILRDHVDILDTLNGIQINDIVFKRGGGGSNGGRIQGHKNFMGNLYSASRLGVSNWHGAVLDGENFLTSVGAQRVDVGLRFSQIVIDSPPDVGQVNMTPSSRIERLNGIHLDSHLDRITLQDENNHFELPLYVDELILNGPIKMTESSHLCQVDVENLWSNAMFKHHNQNISAPMHFSGLVHIAYGGDIQADGLINGIQFGPGKLLMRDGNYTANQLRTPFMFEGDVNVRDLTLQTHLNGIQVAINPVTNRKELAILYNGGTQLVTGDKVFGRVHLGGNNSIYGNINGDLNITDLYRMANVNGMPHSIQTIHLKGNNLRVADGVNVHVDRYINGIPVDDLCSLANRYTQLPYIAHKRLKFDHQPVVFRSLHCGSINGFNDLTKSFMTRHGNQLVRGTLRLTNGAIFNTSLNIRSTLSNMQVAPLARAIARTVNETRSRHKDVRGDLYLDELHVERINDLHLSNVFLSRSDEPQILRAPMVFDQLDIENVLVIGRNLITNTFNGLNVTDILTNTLQYDTPQVVYNHVELATLQLLQNSSFLTKSFNGHDLQRLFADSVLKDVPQQILAPKSFRAPAEFMEHAYLRHGLNELTAEEFRSNMLLHSDEIIEGDLEFENDVIIRKELEIQSGLINDIDINLFVDLMLYENRADRKPMRIVNGSVRFKDVRVHNLVVGGRIQGVDLSRDALMKSENLNGTYDARLREQQALLNNQRLMNSHYGPGSSFRVSSKYRGSDHQGTCYLHSCLPRTTLAPPPGPGPGPAPHSPLGLPHFQPQPQSQAQYRPQQPYPAPTWAPLTYPQQVGKPSNLNNHNNNRPPIKFVQQFYPNLLPQWPQSLVVSNNRTPVVQPTWTPQWGDIEVHRPHLINNMNNYTNTTSIYEHNPNMFSLIDSSKYLEHKFMLQAQAISDLATRINRYLSISFYYDIVQKHPLLGPLLHAARNPILNEHAGNLLLLKATSKLGEPCLTRGQTIAVMAQQSRQWNNMVAFTQSSRIQETSNPSLVDSVVVQHGGGHYLFILDSYPEGGNTMISQVIVYLWDNASGMYEVRERIIVDGFPTALKAFTLDNHRRACFAVANPRLVIHSNYTGTPMLYCQTGGPGSEFGLRIQLPVWHVFDLDIVALPGQQEGMQIVVAALSQQHTEQIGDLTVGVYNFGDKSWTGLALRRMVRPMKLHFFRDLTRPLTLKLVVSEAITSSDDTQAMTRIFALKMVQSAAGFGIGNNRLHLNTSRFYETQIFRDNQFYDIQSVHLDRMHSMLFLQSAHSISIYAPSSINYGDTGDTNYHRHQSDCDDQYALVQRLPTKGANKFLVFNSHIRDVGHMNSYNNVTTFQQRNSSQHFDHFLVLSKDDCAGQQHYATLILKSKFK